MGRVVCEEPGKPDTRSVPDDSFVLLCRAHAGEMAGAAAITSDRRSSTGAGWISGCLRGHGRPGSVAGAAGCSVERLSRRAGALLRVSHYDRTLVAGIWPSVVAAGVSH